MMRKKRRPVQQIRALCEICLVLGVFVSHGQMADGVAMDQMVEEAREAGYSREQIDATLQKVSAEQTVTGSERRTTGVKKNLKTKEADSETMVPPAKSEEVLPHHQAEEVTEESGQSKNKIDSRYFGYSIFQTIPDAFKPNPVGPVDPGYLVGPGDILNLSVWGETQFQYELEVTKEGTVFIPVAGQVYVLGIPFESLVEKLKKILSRHYSGLIKTPPRVFMDLSVAKLRPIRVFFMGAVSQPGGYVISSYATVFNALYSIGGPLTSGSLRDIQIFRNNKMISTVDVYQYLFKGKSDADIRLQNNEVVFIPPRGKTVSVEGEVTVGGIFELKEMENLKELLSYAGNIKATTYTGRFQIERIVPFGQRNERTANNIIIDMPLSRIMENDTTIILFDQDKVTLFRMVNDLSNFVTIQGPVEYPGVYQSEGLMLSELLFKKAMLRDGSVLMERGDIFRNTDGSREKKIIPFSIHEVQKDPGKDRKLMKGDVVILYDSEVALKTHKKVEVRGEVRNPGMYDLPENMTIGGVILQAGGFTPEAYSENVEISRIRITSGDTVATILRIAVPEPFYAVASSPGTGSDSLILEDRDIITVWKHPHFNDLKKIEVLGEVMYPGTYIIREKNERLSSILDRAGGIKREGFVEGGTLMRNGRRVIMSVYKAYVLRDRREDVIVKNNDVITIPTRPNTVSVEGNVNNPGYFSFNEGRTLRDYLKKAGGVSDSVENVFIRLPNGRTIECKTHARIRNTRVYDGSTIFVTRKKPLEKKDTDGVRIGDVIKDIFAIATSALSLIVLAIKLQ